MRVAIFCGSSSGDQPQFTQQTHALGLFLASQGIDLVYGGGKVGLMGAVADAFLQGGASVYGVIPQYLADKEIAHTGVTELEVVADMHARKSRMADLADAFIALPGGAGTLEEVFEVWTWAQLGHHSKPCAFYNIEGFYDPLLAMIKHQIATGFMRPEYGDMLITTNNASELLERINTYEPPKKKWQ